MNINFEEDAPDSLKSLCIRRFIESPVNLDKFILPIELSHLIADTYRTTKRQCENLTSKECEQFYRLFKWPFVTLTRIDFSDLPITDSFFDQFLCSYKKYLTDINISYCEQLSVRSLDSINRYFVDKNDARTKCKSLILGAHMGKVLVDDFAYLKIGRTSLFNPDLRLYKLEFHYFDLESSSNPWYSKPIEFLTPNISRNIRYLDLSYSNIGTGNALKELKSVETLILYECRLDYIEVIPTLINLKKLQFLDLSRMVRGSEEENLNANSDNQANQNYLEQIVIKLERLRKLDISGTDLICGKGLDIPAFESRTDRPFEFLGLFRTNNNGAYRASLPALNVAGEATEQQLLTACEAYIERSGQLTRVLNELNNYYKSMVPNESINDTCKVLKILLPIIERHINDEIVMVQATQSLWWITKLNKDSNNINNKVKRIIISRFLDVMHRHKQNTTILFNGVFPLLLTPSIVYEYSRVASIALYMSRDKDPRTQTWGIILLNTLACQVGNDQKEYIGNLRAIEDMINIINTKVKEDTCDEALETAWSALWNITDETPVNCKRFINHNGLNSFECCMDKFGDHTGKTIDILNYNFISF